MNRANLLIIVLFLTSSHANANLIQNGSFETGPFLGPSDSIVVPKASAPTLSSMAIQDWDVTSNNVEYIRSGAFSSFVGPPGLTAQDGQFFIDLTGGDQGLASIEQSVMLEIGRRYQLEFYIGGTNTLGQFGDPGLPGVTVDIGGLPAMDFFGSRNAVNDWQQQSWTFIATEASSVLRFTGKQDGSNCCYIGLDQVSLHVPEPGTVALLALGLAGLSRGTRKTR